MLNEIEITKQVFDFVFMATGVPETLILAEDRRPHIFEARAVCAYVFRGLGWSYPHIGEALKRHHTTIMSMVIRFNTSPDRKRIDEMATKRWEGFFVPGFIGYPQNPQP